MNKLLNILQEESPMYYSEFHGITHWNRVKRNGLEIARLNGANRSIVQYFSVLHDCKREMKIMILNTVLEVLSLQSCIEI